MTTTDPTAIDSEALATKHALFGLLPSEVDSLFATVEALRERVADLENDNIDSYEKFQLEAAKAIAAEAHFGDLVGALGGLVRVVEAAGLDNLSRGVQLGATSWYVKASDALKYAQSVLSDSERSEEPLE